MHLVVGFENAVGESAEQHHHGEVDLAVAGVRRRVEECERAVCDRHHVARPKVAMDAGRDLRGADELREAFEQPIEAIDDGRVHESPGASARDERGESALAIEDGEVEFAGVLLREDGEVVVVVEPEPRLAGCEMEFREATTERLVVSRGPVSRLQPFEREKIAVVREDSGKAEGARRLGEEREPTRF
jgi:hypothetical protein